MNQRVVAIALVAAFAVCFVGSCTFASFSLINGVATEMKRAKPEPLPLPDEPLPTDDPTPSVADPSDVTPLPDDTAATPTEPQPFEPLDVATAQFSIFHVTPAKADGWKLVEKFAKGSKWEAFRDETGDAEGASVTWRNLATDDYAVIEGSALEHARGLSEKERDDVPKAKRVTVLDLKYPPSQTARLREGSQLAYDLARATGGVLWDEEAQEYLSAAEWKSRRLDGWEKGTPDAALFFTVFVTTAEQGLTLETGGLKHFGLPDLRLGSVPANARESAVALVNLLAQSMVEGSLAPEPGTHALSVAGLHHAERKAALEQRQFAGARGETDLTLTSIGTIGQPRLDVGFPGSGGPSARVDAALSALFGSQDAVTPIEHDAQLLALSKAQMELFNKSIKPRFLKGLKPGEVLLVKAPFPADSGGNEWMWVEVSKIRPDGQILGLLSNDPSDIKDLKSGDDVVVVEGELFDWMLKEKSGKTLGNETGKVMEKRSKK